MPRKQYPSDLAHNSARASEKKNKRVRNVIKFALSKAEIDMSDEPEWRSDPEKWRKWARAKLETMCDELEDDRAKVQAAKALSESLDRQLESKQAIVAHIQSEGAGKGLPANMGDPLERLRALPLPEAEAEVARGQLVFDEAKRILEERKARGE